MSASDDHGSAPQPGTVRPATPGRRRRLFGAIGGLGAAALTALSALTPWWFTSTSTGATSSQALFYPGGSLYAGGGGSGGFTTYAAEGLGPVGALYVSVLVLAVVVALLAAAAGLMLLVGRRSPRHALARIALVVAMVVGALLVIAVPAAQPDLYRAANPGGGCSTLGSPNVCDSFWGSMSAAGRSVSWGAGLGWWLDLAAVILLGLAIYLVASSEVLSPDGEASTVMEGLERASAPRSPVALRDLRRLEELRALEEKGLVPHGTFEEAKRELIAAPVPSGASGPVSRAPLPSEELAVLRRLHERGALTDGEYETLERRVLLWL